MAGKRKRHVEKKMAPSEPWGLRVDRLIKACGWKRDEAAQKFGVDASWLTRIRYWDARPLVAFVRNLRKLEETYAEDLAALDQGLIQFNGSIRLDWRPKRAGQRRPDDLAALGEVGDQGPVSSDADGRTGNGEPSDPARSSDDAFDARRLHSPRDCAHQI
jgi:hypothetical protein